jgi:hypothetical protein
MNADEQEESLNRLVESVSEGRPVDWDEESSHADERARPTIHALHDLALITAAHRDLQRHAGPAEGSEAEAQRWGDLILLERVGSGTAGDVYRAWDPGLQRDVALKLLKRTEVPPDQRRLLDEARALARVRHPNVIAVHGVAEHDGRAGLWMEFAPGRTLEAEIESRGTLPPDEVARIGLQLARALAAVHEAGVVHRDVKPANVICASADRIVLGDFGLGRRGFEAAGGLEALSGTPLFMSPEQLRGEPATPRSDVYAAGVTLWYALTGKPPFRAANLAELRAAAQAGPSISLAAACPQAPRALVAAIERAMAPDPAARFGDGAGLARAIEAVAAPGVVVAGGSRARGSRALGLAAAAAVLVALAWFAWQRGAMRAAVPAGVPRASTSAASSSGAYEVEAALLRHEGAATARLQAGDRVQPGDRISLDFRATRPLYVYVLNEDERGETFLLFPQPMFDARNPLAPDSLVRLPGSVDGRPIAWNVTSAGGREHFLVVASPDPVPDLESRLPALPAPAPGRPITYPPVPGAAIERLRGVGGVAEVPSSRPGPASGLFEEFRALASRESGVSGLWVRQITLQNPAP